MKKNVYLKYDKSGRLIPGAVTVATKKPSGKFKQLVNPAPNKVCCNNNNL